MRYILSVKYIWSDKNNCWRNEDDRWTPKYLDGNPSSNYTFFTTYALWTALCPNLFFLCDCS